MMRAFKSKVIRESRKPEKTKSKPKGQASEQSQEPKPTLVQNNHERSKKIKSKLEDLERTLKDSGKNTPKTLIGETTLTDLREGSICSNSTKQLCARVIIQIYEHPHLRSRLEPLQDCIIPLMVEMAVYLSERVVTNFVEAILDSGMVEVDSVNVSDFCRRWGQNPKSTLFTMLIDQFLIFLRKDGKSARTSTFSRALVAQLTKSLTEMQQVPTKTRDKIFEIYQSYLATEAVNFGHFQEQEQALLPFVWAHQSCNSKNPNSQLFEQIMTELKSLFKKRPEQYIAFLSCLFRVYEDGQGHKAAVRKFVVLMKYQEIFLALIASPNIEDNMREKNTERLVNRMFKLAEFCDEAKKNHVLQKMLKDSEEIVDSRTASSDSWTFDYCESALYRTIICVEKALPNYPLKFYKEGLLCKPGLFHLHLMEGILEKREQWEVKSLMLGLIQKWIRYEMREFNILSSVTKFILAYLRKSDSHIDTLLAFLKQLELPTLVELNWLFFQASFPQIPKNELYLALPSTLACYEQESELKACGYVGKTLFIDRNFSIAPELFSWSALLCEIYDDWFYYPLKYYYHLLGSTLSLQSKQGQSSLKRLSVLWEEAIHKSKTNDVYSIFQMISCVQISSFNPEQLTIIMRVLLREHDKIIKLIDGGSNLLWKETIKTLQTHSQLFDNYKRQEEKSKKMHWHFIGSVLHFFEKVATASLDVCQLVPKDISYEQAIEIIKSYSQVHSNAGMTALLPPCYRIIRLLSQSAAHNIFAKECSVKLVNESKSKMRKHRIELVREIIFSYLQAKSEFEAQSLRLLMAQEEALQFCISTLCIEEEPGLLQKQILASKLVAMECLLEIFRSFEQNPNSKRFLKWCTQERCERNIKAAVWRILFRDSAILLAKYEKKMILFIRSSALSLVCDCRNSLPTTLFRLTTSQHTFITLWHFALDEEIELRIQVLSILTNIYKNMHDHLQSQLYLVLAVMALVESFDPRRRLRAYAEQISEQYEQILNQRPGFVYILGLFIGWLAFNCKVNLPFFDLFATFSQHWLKSKDHQYLFYLIIEEIQKKRYAYRSVQLPDDRAELKVYHINLKTKKGWVNWKEEGRSKSDSIFRSMKQVIVEKNKSSRFLKSKRDAIVNWQQIENFHFFET